MTTIDKIDFFICGSERSGTTVTGATMDAMPEVCAVQATMVMTRINNLFEMIQRVQAQGGEIEGVDKAHCEDLETFLTNVAVTPFLHKTLFHYCFYENLVHSSRSDVTKDILSQKAYVSAFDFGRYMAAFDPAQPTWARTVAAMYAEFAAFVGTGEATVFGEQTPDNALRTKAIQAIYPDAKFIFMVRHPVTAIASLMDRYTDLDYATRQYRNPFAHFPFNDQEVMDATLFVKFEDMLLNRDLILNQIRAHLGLPAMTFAEGDESHESKVFSKYVGNALSVERYYRSVTKYPVALRAEILQKNHDVANVFYTEADSRAIVGYEAAA